jgi:xanthine/uracil/vitamin C permease (AzgA family)
VWGCWDQSESTCVLLLRVCFLFVHIRCRFVNVISTSLTWKRDRRLLQSPTAFKSKADRALLLGSVSHVTGSLITSSNGINGF